MPKRKGIISLERKPIRPSEFLIAQNPLLDDNRIFILHTRKPLILCEAYHFKLNQKEELQHCQDSYTIGVMVEFSDQFVYLGVNNIEHNMLSATKVHEIPTQMGDWYHAFVMDKLFST